MQTWIKFTIAEPFPVLFGHVQCSTEGHRETAKGPFYAAGSSWYEPVQQRASFIEWKAGMLRERGWTVTVETVQR